LREVVELTALGFINRESVAAFTLGWLKQDHPTDSSCSCAGRQAVDLRDRREWVCQRSPKEDRCAKAL
jgi:hypothetical protein